MDAAPGLTAATPGLSPRSLSRSGALGPTVGQHEEQKGDCGTQDSASPAGAELCTCRHQNRDWVAGTGEQGREAAGRLGSNQGLWCP